MGLLLVAFGPRASVSLEGRGVRLVSPGQLPGSHFPASVSVPSVSGSQPAPDLTAAQSLNKVCFYCLPVWLLFPVVKELLAPAV